MVLLFKSKKIEDSNNRAFIRFKAIDAEGKIKEMSIFDIVILRHFIRVRLMKGKELYQLGIEIRKEDNIAGAILRDIRFYILAMKVINE